MFFRNQIGFKGIALSGNQSSEARLILFGKSMIENKQACVGTERSEGKLAYFKEWIRGGLS